MFCMCCSYLLLCASAISEHCLVNLCFGSLRCKHATCLLCVPVLLHATCQTLTALCASLLHAMRQVLTALCASLLHAMSQVLTALCACFASCNAPSAYCSVCLFCFMQSAKCLLLCVPLLLHAAADAVHSSAAAALSPQSASFAPVPERDSLLPEPPQHPL